MIPARFGGPLANSRFRVFYLGSGATALGYTMQATVAAWLMATLTPSPLLVALVQTASTAPFLLFGLFAGALADIVDRRRQIVITQIAMLGFGLLLGFVTLKGWATPINLLVLTFLIGTAFSFYLPAQQASVNELVPRAQLPQAVALGAVAYNVARAIGPGIAGTVAAASSTGAAMVISALAFLPMLLGSRALKRADRALPGIPESLFSGVLVGLRFARHSSAMRAHVFRNASFAICASALLGLLPLLARDQFNLGPGGFGLMFSVFGAGAVVSATTIPAQLKRLSLNRVVQISVGVWTLAILLIAASTHVAVALIGCAFCGACWVGIFASLSTGTQSTAPAWVRARAVSVNMVAVQASLAIGSALWGALAARLDAPLTLICSAALLVVLQLVGWRIRVELGSDDDVTPIPPLPEMTLSMDLTATDGPVLVQREYRVAEEKRASFLRAIREVEPTRRRNGATSWRMFRDVSEADRFVERFIIPSWGEYVRSRSRMTMADRVLQDKAAALQKPGVPIRVSRLIGIELKDELRHTDEADAVAARPDPDAVTRPVVQPSASPAPDAASTESMKDNTIRPN